MLLAELLAEESVPDYIKRLTSTLNIRQLGKGAFASVFQHPVYHNVAVKIFEYDPMYVKFIKICQKTTNRWLPKVVSVHKVKMDEVKTWRHDVHGDKIGKTEAWIVFFEKLRKASNAELKAAVQDILSDIPDSYFEEDGDLEHFYRDDFIDFEDLDPEVWAVIARATKRADVKQLAKILVKVDAADIHAENVMIRDDGQLVFTDPVAS
jgi:hypothetical protein